MSTAPRILVYCRRPEEYAKWLREAGCPGTIRTAADPATAARHIGDTEVLFAWHFPPELFRDARRLRWVQSMGAGVEDLVSAPLPPDVTICRIVDQFGGPISEYVMAELLSRVRRRDELRALQGLHRWEPVEVDTLAGRIMGIAGLGSIGRALALRAAAFGMEIRGLSRHRPEWPLAAWYGPDRWLDFVRDLDVLVLTLPLTPETERVVDRTVLAAMKSTAILVNVGRGRLVDQDALTDALTRGQIGGAVLDVFDEEPLPPSHPLWDLPFVTVTPHIAGPSRVDDVARFFLTNIRRERQGLPLLGVVDREGGY
jgi:glyoxylate/hydroxypyruvate reductase A